MDKSEYEKVIKFLKENGFKVKDYLSNGKQFSKDVDTDDKNIKIHISGEIKYWVTEK